MSSRRLRPFIAFVMPFAALLLFRGQAQTQGENPHGDLKMSCADCHTAEGWQLATETKFHHDQVGFPLDASHEGIGCRSCHKTLVFSSVGAACADCHRDPHKGELGFRCEACHTSRSWDNRREMFEKHNRTLFPLFSVHTNVDCDSCHRGQQPNQYVTTPTDCGTCHAQSYASARSPNHVLAGFSRTCQDCHPPFSQTWNQANYHHPDTYPLVGAHASARCGDCHTTTYKGTPRECVACHRKDYNGAKNPNHSASGFPTSCNSCHTVQAWQPALFTDHSRTGFPLTGAHASVDCAQCHPNGRFAGTPRDCYSCHKSNYDSTNNPNHAAAGIPTTCDACHSTTAWQPANNFNHNNTPFPLTGAHRSVPCAQCHVNGRFAGTPTDCYSCHKSNYDSTNNPNHAAAGFPTSCQTCHTTTAWQPASFDHNKTPFPLTGAHTSVSCDRCHPGGRFAGTPTDCYSCHKSDYDSTRDPNHRAEGFPTTCQNCHNTGSWQGAGDVRKKRRF
jgi:hypothetical protein